MLVNMQPATRPNLLPTTNCGRWCSNTVVQDTLEVWFFLRLWWLHVLNFGVSEQFLSVLLSFLEILSHTLGGRIIFSIFDELYGVSVIAFDRRMRIIYLLKVLHSLFGEYLRICKLSLRLTEQHLGDILHN